MKYIDEYRNPELMQALAQRLRARPRPRARLMEVCGTHTMSIAKFGIRELLPEGVSLVSGPGCPVCVTPQEDIDLFLAMGRLPCVSLSTFGDMMRVPGTETTLLKERAAGADVHVVYSPMDAIRLAQSRPERQIVFFGVGFETTVPGVAGAIAEARRQDIPNFSTLCAHKVVPPALEALAAAPDLKIDGFICPGHVSVIIGSRPYEFLAERFSIPCVITGFEPVDILVGVEMLLEQIESGPPRAEIQYTRAVSPEGNPRAQAAIRDVFEPCDAAWRGIGIIPGSGLKLRPEYSRYDARTRFEIPALPPVPNTPCRCGEVLRGVVIPEDCSLFGTACTPLDPVGACMVSSEGACAAFYKYRMGAAKR
ncbi:MAG: hydrogenase formation protein HypD [Armatimonadetes bacterium]|nr:hydrogenase formation protein HypD [Armatimonadota bacterium]